MQSTASVIDAGPMLSTFDLAASARRRMLSAALDHDLARWERERETYASMLRRTAFWYGG